MLTKFQPTKSEFEPKANGFIEGSKTNSIAEQQFNREMIEDTDRFQREISYNPQRFRQMVSEHGGVGAVQRLLQGRDASDGFTTLWEHGRLEMS